MIDRIIAISVRKPLLTGILTLALICGGISSLIKLPVDAVPDVTGIQVDIITNSPSLASLEIERFITSPVEMAMSNIPGLVEIRSTSKFGLSVVKLIFTDETDVYWARQQVFERLELVKSEIPEELGKPTMGPVSTGLGEVFQYIIRPKDPEDKSFSLMEIRTLQDWVIRKQLLGVPGIAEVSGFGGYKKEYQAKVKPDRMKALDITMDELYEALSKGNSNTGGAYIEKNNRAYTIRGVGLAGSLEDIGNTVIKVKHSVPVLVKDVADVDFGKSIRYGAITADGKGEVVGGIIMMMKGENGNEVIRRIKDKMKVIEAGLPQGLVIEPFIDREKIVNKAVKTVSTNLIEGALIVVIVILVFLGNWRASLLAASVIPLSMFFAFIFMVSTGVAGNLMSLGAIDFGLLVDPAIIVVESVVFFLAIKMSQSGKKKMTYNERQDVVVNAASDVKKSVIFGGLIILIVYFPILTLSGIEGKMFIPMAKTVSFAIAGALLLSITYVPMMSALILRPPKNPHDHGFSEKIVKFLYKYLEKVLKKGLQYKPAVFGFVGVVLIAGYLGFKYIGGEFIPKLQEGDLVIETNLPVGTSLTESIKLSTRIQEVLKKNFPDEIERIVSKIGTSEVPVDPMPLEAQEIVVVLSDKDKWTKAKTQEELAAKVAEVMEVFPGTIISVQQPIENRVNELMSGARTDVVVKLFGQNLDTMVVKGNQIINIIKSVEGAADVQENKIFGLPQININYNRSRMAHYGITVDQVNRAVQTAYAGAVAGIVYENDKRFDLTMRLTGADRDREDNLSNLLLDDKDGNPIPLKQIADISEDIGPAQIDHENLQRRVNIGFNVRGRDLESVVNDVIAKVSDNVYLPTGYSLEYGGEFENLNRAKKRLAIVVPVALLIIFGLLYATFGTVRDSLLIYSVVPLSAVGGVFSLLIRDMNFSISAGVGFIALFGISVLNGILLVGRFNELGNNGIADPVERVLKGMPDRFRPVLMTSCVAALGFMPMALSTSAGAEVQKPLATVVIGGLFTATILTLIVLPVFYTVFQPSKARGGTAPDLAKSTVSVVILFLLSAATSETHAQTPVSLEVAIQRALEQNKEVQMAEGKVQQERYLLPSAFSIMGPEVFIEAPNGNQMRPGIMQSFFYPGVYTAQHKAQKSKVEMAGSEQKVVANQVAWKIKDAYVDLQYLSAKVDLLRHQDSVYSNILRINEVRYGVGEISNLEKINGEAQYKKIRYNLIKARADLQSAMIRFRLLMGVEGDSLFVPKDSIGKWPSPLAEEQPSVSENPLMDYHQRQETYQNYLLKSEKRKRIPGFAIGYLNQGHDNSTPFPNRIRGGITLPLWYWTYSSSIRAAKKGLEIAKIRTDYTANQLNTELSTAISEFREQESNLNFFTDVGLRQIEELSHSASEAYRLGSIGYYAFLQNMELVYESRLNYLENLKNYNQSVIYIQYLIGKKEL